VTVAGLVDWTNVLVALIAGLPAIIAAVGVLLVHQKIKTPSGTPIGEQVEDTLHTAIVSNHHLVAAAEDRRTVAADLAAAKAARTSAPPGTPDDPTKPGA
jgi:hypothetical protein